MKEIRGRRMLVFNVYARLRAFPPLSFGVLVVVDPVVLPVDYFRFSRSYSLNDEGSLRSGVVMLVN